MRFNTQHKSYLMLVGLVGVFGLSAPVPGDEGSHVAVAASSWSGFGEGFSSPANGEPVKVSVRTHTAPSLTEWLKSGLIVDRLEVTPRTLQIRVGEPLYLGYLQVFALDPNGQIVERIPLIFSLEGPDAIFDFEGYRSHSTDILTTGPGRATIWVESLLPTTSGERLREPIELTVR